MKLENLEPGTLPVRIEAIWVAAAIPDLPVDEELNSPLGRRGL
jgi:hypothetical protein